MGRIPWTHTVPKSKLPSLVGNPLTFNQFILLFELMIKKYPNYTVFKEHLINAYKMKIPVNYNRYLTFLQPNNSDNEQASDETGETL